MIDWSTKVAAWSRVGPDDALDRLNAHLAADGMVALGPIDFGFTTEHADYWNQQPVVLAECRALRLRHPSPFPRIRLFAWSRRRGRA